MLLAFNMTVLKILTGAGWMKDEESDVSVQGEQCGLCSYVVYEHNG